MKSILRAKSSLIHRAGGRKQAFHLVRKGVVLRRGEVRIGRKQSFGLLLGHLQRAGILHQVRNLQGGQAVLRFAEEIAGAAGFQVIFGDLEPVRGTAEEVQPIPHGLVFVV